MRANPEQLAGQNFSVSGIWIHRTDSFCQFISKPGIHIQRCFQLMFKRRNEIKIMNRKQSEYGDP